MGFTNKTGKYISYRKFTLENIIYYGVWVSNIVHYPVLRVKYLDEASFDDGNLRRHRGWAPAGVPLARAAAPPANRSYTAFAITSLTHERGFRVSVPSTGTNNSLNFIRFIMECLQTNTLVSGDLLVCDSAPIHTSKASLLIVSALCGFMNIRLVFLPKYSPELNPVELIWAQVKNTMRNRGHGTFGQELVEAFSTINREMVKGYYRHCQYSWFS